MEDFLSFLFDTPTNKLPDKYQRGKQTLENKETAYIILNAACTSVHAMDQKPLTGEFVETYFQICSERPKTKKRRIEDIVLDQLNLMNGIMGGPPGTSNDETNIRSDGVVTGGKLKIPLNPFV